MAVFLAYAKVLEPGDPSMRIYEAGLRPCPGLPGMPLVDVLRRSGGDYATTAFLTPELRADIREVAELTADAELRAIAEHLRDLDPQTRIIIHIELRYEADESDRLGKAADDRPALATIKPDGTVVAGDWSPSPPAPTQRGG
jgi:hypothetical protein